MNLMTILTLLPEHLVGKTAHLKEVPTVNLTPAAENSSYVIADLLMKASYWILSVIGQQHNGVLLTWVYALLVLFLSLGIGYVVKFIVLFIVRRLGKVINSDINNVLQEHRFYSKLVNIVPALVFLILIQFTLYTKVTLATWLTRFTWVYVVFVVALALTSFSTAIWQHLDQRENHKKLPLKGIIQLIQGIIWILAVIIMVAILCNKSPGSLLAGLGVFASVLMLIFKDSILGVVAGVQLAENDSLHVGDWVAIPDGNANGTVQEVTLTAVKILNWDKTTSTVPPYSLISKGFKNYRSMQESNTRRIQRSYFIDADSVVTVDDTMLAEFAKIPLLSDWLKAKIAQKQQGIDDVTNNPSGLVDGTIETNLGIFRAYVKLYLDNNKYIDKNSDCFVTTLAQTSVGIPFQVYCFTNTSKWFPYEAIQAAIFEHIAVMLYKFHLYTFEDPSGRDTILEGYLSPGMNPEYVNGLPYPFFLSSGTPEIPGIPPQSGLYPRLTPEQTEQVVSELQPGSAQLGQDAKSTVAPGNNASPK